MNINKQRGFTIIEVLMVMVVLGILATIAIPVLLNALPSLRLKSSTRDIFSLLLKAKGEAINRSESVTILFNPAGNSYSGFIDNGAGAGGIANDQIQNGGEQTLLPPILLPNNVSFDPTADVDGVSFANNAVTFSPRGLSVGPGGGLIMGTISLRATDNSGNVINRRSITLASGGRIRVQ